MNTRVHYLYRDASNYKQASSVVMEGEPTDEQGQRILAHQEMFLPAQVGLEPLYTLWGTHYEDDHPWHEIVELELTSAVATHPESIAEFADRFRDVVWDEQLAADALDAWVSRTPSGR